MNNAHTNCPAYNQPVAVDLPHGTTLYGFAAGCVFGDPTSAHEHFVNVHTAVWADGTIVNVNSGNAGKFWGVRALTAQEVAAADAKAAADRIRYDY
jgi:hypothetical protein